jgi:hypothetical protein
MPLTPAHAAAALPIDRAIRALGFTLPLSAVMIGTWAPDFEYLLLLRPGGKFGHTPLGLIVFCLPLGLLAWATFERLIVPALLPLLPPGLETRVRADRRARDGHGVVAAGAAVLLGAISHVVWDAFGHSGPLVRWLPVLLAPAFPSALPPVPWYKIIQHGSTLVGAVVLCAWAWWWLRAQDPATLAYRGRSPRRVVRVAASILVAASVGAALNALRVHDASLTSLLALAAVGAMAACTLAIVSYGVLVRLWGAVASP